MTPEQFAKLPKFAQEEFNDLQRERDTAVRSLQWNQVGVGWILFGFFNSIT